MTEKLIDLDALRLLAEASKSHNTAALEALAKKIKEQGYLSGEGLEGVLSKYAKTDHTHSAGDVMFDDGKTFQEKLEAGELQGGIGVPGPKGADGISPVIEIEDVEGGTKVKITDVDNEDEFLIPDGKTGPQGVKGDDGISPTLSVSKLDGVTTVTIIDHEGTKTATINDGAKGERGEKGNTGDEGFSPTVETSAVDGGTQVTITDKSGPHTFTVQNGPKGERGEKGLTGDKGDTGEAGAQGPTGKTGDTGPQGPAGADGGYYKPSVDASGNLTWTGTKEGMAEVTGANIKGPAGEKGVAGPAGPAGPAGENGATGPAGKDGTSPKVTVSKSGKVTTVKIVDASGTTSAEINDGADGATGPAGPAGTPGTAGAKGADGITWRPSVNADTGVISWAKDSSTDAPTSVNIKGPKGDTGANGAAGPAGPAGAAGPNKVSSETATDINGILKGNGSKVVAATDGTDYISKTKGDGFYLGKTAKAESAKEADVLTPVKIDANTDINTLTTPGKLYYTKLTNDARTMKNAPFNEAFAMFVFGAYTTQLAISYPTTGAKVAFRNFYGTAWGAWEQIYPATNAATADTAKKVANKLTFNGAVTGEYDGSAAKEVTIPSGAAASSTVPKAAGSATAGTENAFARGDHVHPAQTSITGNAATATTATKLGTQTVGSTTKPIYLNAGSPVAIDKVAAASTADTATKLGSSTVGSATQPIYLASGVPKAGSTMPSVLTFTNKTVATSAWTSDTTYTDYKFKADVTGLTGVTANHFASVVFSVADATGGNFAPVVSSGASLVTIYAKEKPQVAVTIPSIVCIK